LLSTDSVATRLPFGAKSGRFWLLSIIWIAASHRREGGVFVLALIKRECSLSARAVLTTHRGLRRLKPWLDGGGQTSGMEYLPLFHDPWHVASTARIGGRKWVGCNPPHFVDNSQGKLRIQDEDWKLHRRFFAMIGGGRFLKPVGKGRS
jgi:hypothetical protein